MMIGRTIGLVYDMRQADSLAPGQPADYYAEFDAPETIEHLAGAITALGYEVDLIGNFYDLVDALAAGKRWSLVFNISEGLTGRAREARVPALLEAYQVPYTGSDAATLALTLDKSLTKKVWLAERLPTAPFVTVTHLSRLREDALPAFPLFVKPAWEGSSKGIDAGAVVHDGPALRSRVTQLLHCYRQPVLLERFLSGKEYTVAMLGSGEEAWVLGTREMISHDPLGILSYDEKEGHRDDAEFSKPLADRALQEALEAIALRAYRAVQCQDFGRVDLRLDEAGNIHLLEINPLANLDPVHSSLAVMARARNLSYEDLLGIIIESASRRYESEFHACA